jgi:hypothetical protein
MPATFTLGIVTLIAGLVISLGAPFEGTAPLACDVAELL